MMSSRIPLRATNPRRQRMNAWVVRLGVSSICKALVLPQVNKQMYTLLTWISFPKTVFTKQAVWWSLLLSLQRGILPWIWIQAYLTMIQPCMTFLHVFYTLCSCNLFSDDLPSVREQETRSQPCQRFSCPIVHHLVVTVSDYEPCDMVITWQPCGKLSWFR